MSILISCSLSDSKDYAVERWIDNAKKFTPACHIVLCDNTPDDGTYSKYLYERYAVSVLRIEPKGTNQEILRESQNMIRKWLLAYGFDYLFHVEIDIFPPQWALQYLLLFDVPVMCLPYFIWWKEDSYLCLQGIYKYGPFFQFPVEFIPEDFDGSIKKLDDFGDQSYGLINPGLGCALIKRSVLEKIEFRTDANQRSAFPDSFFFRDCVGSGTSVLLSSQIIVEHEPNRGWGSRTN